MSANVDAIAFVVDGARDAAHELAFLENDGLDAGPGEQLVGSGQSRRTGSNDNRAFLIRVGHSGDACQPKVRLQWYQSKWYGLRRRISNHPTKCEDAPRGEPRPA